MAVKGLAPNARAALLISEMQNGIANPTFNDTPLIGQVVARGLPERINSLAGQFRARQRPVIHCTISARPDFVAWHVNCFLAARIAKEGRLVAGTPFAAIHDDITVAESDIVSARHHGMAPFTGTDLVATLRALGIDTVVFCGVSTNVALMGGSVEAVGHGFNVVLAEDCAAGGTAETHQMQVTMHLPLIARIAQSGEIVETLKGPIAA